MTSGGFQLAQINIGRPKHANDAPEFADFIGALSRINALAESQPGFVWRLTGAGDNAIDLRPFEDPNMAVNLSVWTGIEPLAAFVYRTGHRDIMRRRREWFEEMTIYQALWWVPAGSRPTPLDGKMRIDLLELMGPSPDAFTFRHPFPAPNASSPEAPILDRCA